MAMKFLEGMAFFSLMLILAKYLSDVIGFSDVEAGWLFALCNGMQFPFALCLSFVLDSWGARRMCMIGQALLLVSRASLWLSSSPILVCFVLIVLYPLGTAALLPALIVAVKRFSTPLSRPYAFGMFYTCLNVASICIMGVFNYFRHNSEGSQLYTRVLLLGCVTSAVGLLSSVILTDASEPSLSDMGSQDVLPAPAVSKLQGVLDTFQSSHFWRFMAVIGSFVMIRAIFGHLKATVPKWMTREFGEDTPYELYIGINPALIIVLVPLCTRICELWQLKTESALIVGAMISGFSPFILALIVPSTLAVAGFIAVFSIGEAIWSPKLLEYTVSVPQEGREGVFVACGSAPLYLAKFIAGATSGYLLKYYCPRPDTADSDEGCRTRALWMAIALSTSITPVILLLFRQQLFAKSQEDDDCESTGLLKKGTG